MWTYLSSLSRTTSLERIVTSFSLGVFLSRGCLDLILLLFAF